MYRDKGKGVGLKLGLKGQFPPLFPNQTKKVETNGDGTQVVLIENEDVQALDPTDRKEDGEVMEGLDDLRTHVDQLNDGFQLNQGELATIRQDIFEINDTIKNLLAVFESMAPGGDLRVKNSNLEVSGENCDAEAIEDPVRTIPELEIPTPNAMMGSENSINSGMTQSPSRKVSVTVPRAKDTSNVAQVPSERDSNDQNRQHSVFQAQKVLEFEVDKLFVMKLKDTPIGAQDLERFDRCVEEFRRLIR